MRTAAIILCLAVAGCSFGPNGVVLRNPKSGEVAQCHADPWSTFRYREATEACAKGYEAAGWVRTGEY